MPQQVTFNGSVLIRPGSASAVDASQFENIELSGSSIVAVIGEADDGPPRVLQGFRDAGLVKSAYGSGDLVEAAQILCDPSNDPAISTGAQQIYAYKINNSLQASLSKAPHTFKTRKYGLGANITTMALSAGTTTIGRIATFKGLDPAGAQILEISPSLGETAKIAIAYVGAGSACTMTVSATQLTTAVTGGPGGENLAINFADYRSLLEIVTYIDSLAAYTCTALVTNVGSFDPSYLDAVTAVPIKARTGAAASIVAGAAAGQVRLTGLTGMLATDVGQYITISGAASAANNGTFKISVFTSATSVDVYNPSAVVPDANNGAVAWTTVSYYEYATNFDLLDWVNKSSVLALDDTTLYTKGSAGPIAVFTEIGFTGGTRGTSSSTDWVNALAALENTRINLVVPLISADATTSQGTFVVDAVIAALTAHCKKMSGTAGKSERQGFAGVLKTKAAYIALLQAQNSTHVCISAQTQLRLKVATSALEYLPAWSSACLAAGMRAGAPIQEPITHKIVNSQGCTQDASWSDQSTPDIEDILKAGGLVFTNVPGKGVVVEKGITTYTASDNDAFAQESVVNVWKLYSYDLRKAIDDRIIGHGGDLELVSSVAGVIDTVSFGYQKRRAITNGIDPVTGEEVNAWRGVSILLRGGLLYVDVTITVVQGVDFALSTIHVVPATIAA